MYRLGKAQTEGKPEFILKHQANDSEGRATQRKRIARAGWLFADRKKRYQRINFVGERDNDAVGLRGAGVIRTQRSVVFVDRIGDRRMFAVMQRVIESHNT